MDLKKINNEIISNLKIITTVDIKIVDEIPNEVPFYLWKDLEIKSKKTSNRIDVTYKTPIQIAESIEEVIINQFRKFCTKNTNKELILNKSDNFYTVFENLKKCFDKCSLCINKNSGIGGANALLINPKLYHLLYSWSLKENSHNKTIVDSVKLSNSFKDRISFLTVSKFVNDDEIIVYRKPEFKHEPNYSFFVTLIQEEKRRKKSIEYSTFINHQNKNFEKIQIKW